jgi:hypothetical protein
MTPEQAICVGIIRDGLRRAHRAAEDFMREHPDWEVTVELKCRDDEDDSDQPNFDDPDLAAVTLDTVREVTVLFNLSGVVDPFFSAPVQDTVAAMLDALRGCVEGWVRASAAGLG